MSVIIGIQSGHESSAVVVKDGRVLAAISEERLSRIKNDGGEMPQRTIDRVLAMGGLCRTDVNKVAMQYTYLPEKYFVRESWAKELECRINRFKRGLLGKPDRQLLACNHLERLMARGKSFASHFRAKEFIAGEGFGQAGVDFYDHHQAHAILAAHFSGFDKAAVFTMDGSGDFGIHFSASAYEGGKLQRRHVSDANGASPGMFYSNITKMLGFIPMRHEGKVIGLAAFGNPKLLYDAYLKALRLSDDGLALTSDFVGRARPDEERYDYLRKVSAGFSREDISAAAQQVLEDVVLALIKNHLKLLGSDCVALNGGVFANVKLNQRIAALPEVSRVFVFPAMSDTGNSLGAALLDMEANFPQEFEASRCRLESVYWGPEYSPEEIEAELKRQGLSYQRFDDDKLVCTAAQAIHDGQVVGWFQGRMEFGPRALGNRSMLARPTKADINDWLNQRLDRSEFMPFAPSVLEEHADDIFENVEPARHTAEFMTVTFDVKPAWRERINAVVHVDGTARPQLVSLRTNPLYHRLISAYNALSGIPLVLNTSFNVHEEPIVCAPPEAIRAYVEKRVDCLGIGPFWLDSRN